MSVKRYIVFNYARGESSEELLHSIVPRANNTGLYTKKFLRREILNGTSSHPHK